MPPLPSLASVASAARRALWIALIGMLLVARGALAQAVVAGVVVDDGGRGLGDATVTIVDAQGTERGAARTDSLGQFSIRARADGPVRVRARRLGYAPAETTPMPFDSATAKPFRFTLLPQALAAVVVTGSATRQGFEARRAAAAGRRIGRYLDSTEIAAMNAPLASELIDRIRFAAFGVRCVVIDGWFVGRAPYLLDRTRSSLYDQAALGDLRGVEIYDDPMMIPTDLQKKMSWPRGTPPCARVVFLWTKDAFRR